MTLKRLFLLVSLLFVSFSTFAHQSSTTSTPITKDPQAVSLAAASLAALSGSTAITDVTLTGTATRTAGSDVESGNFTSKALGSSESRLDLSLSGGTSTEVFNASGGGSQSFWSVNNGNPNPMAYHNTLVSAVWFFPALSVLSQASNPSFQVRYLGSETKQGISVQHLHLELQSVTASPTDNLFLARLSGTDIYLDSSSHLPVALVFSTHPDSNSLSDIPVEVDFSDYETVNGIPVPFHIQKFMNGSLFLDLTVQAASMNSGLADSTFLIN